MNQFPQSHWYVEIFTAIGVIVADSKNPAKIEVSEKILLKYTTPLFSIVHYYYNVSTEVAWHEGEILNAVTVGKNWIISKQIMQTVLLRL